MSPFPISQWHVDVLCLHNHVSCVHLHDVCSHVHIMSDQGTGRVKEMEGKGCGLFCSVSLWSASLFVCTCWSQPLVSWRQMKRCVSIRESQNTHCPPRLLLLFIFLLLCLARLTHHSAAIFKYDFSKTEFSCCIAVLEPFLYILRALLSDYGTWRGRPSHTLIYCQKNTAWEWSCNDMDMFAVCWFCLMLLH